MQKYFEMSEIAQEVADCLEEQLYDCKDDCRMGRVSGSMIQCIIQTVLDTLDNWSPKLTAVVRLEVLDWFQSVYGLCL
ncbi:MAG: hypothetical protein ACLS95_07375 [Clostridia bacterium]